MVALLQLTHDLLKEVGVKSVGQRTTILESTRSLGLEFAEAQVQRTEPDAISAGKPKRLPC